MPRFEDATGITVDYEPEIVDNDESYDRIEGPLADGESIGADIIVPTGWVAARLVEEGALHRLPWNRIPNAGNLVGRLRDPAWDPTGTYTLRGSRG